MKVLPNYSSINSMEEDYRTVGQLQFEVIQYRLENEYNAKCRWEPVHLHKACWIEADDEQELDNFKSANISTWQRTEKDVMCS